MSSSTKHYLVCSECKHYLSCGPTFIRKSRYSVCGRCADINERGIRNILYEIAASRLRFPCCFRQFGCQETQEFVDAFEYSHEYACEYRKYKCIFREYFEMECSWRGFKNKLIDHCQTKHPDKVLINCFKLSFDVRYPHQRTYLLVAFERPFILHVKVYKTSINTKSIAFQLEFLGKQEAGAEFQYTLNIQKGRSLVTKIGSARVLTVTEIEVSSLEDFFDGFDGATYHFTVTVRCTACHKELIFGKLFNHGASWFCEECTPYLNYCANSKDGCKFKDYKLKMSKHEKYFCKRAPINASSNMTILEYGKIWMIKRSYEKVVFTTDIGLIVAEFKSMKTEGKYEIFAYAPITNDQEQDFTCKFCIGNRFDGESLYFYPKFEYGEEYDWHLELDRKEHPSWGSELAVLIAVQRKTFHPPMNQLF